MVGFYPTVIEPWKSKGWGRCLWRVGCCMFFHVSIFESIRNNNVLWKAYKTYTMQRSSKTEGEWLVWHVMFLKMLHGASASVGMGPRQDPLAPEAPSTAPYRHQCCCSPRARPGPTGIHHCLACGAITAASLPTNLWWHYLKILGYLKCHWE